MTAQADDLLTVAEVAEILRKPAGTLRYWRSINRGPRSFRVGSTVVYERADVAAYLEQQKNETERGGA